MVADCASYCGVAAHCCCVHDSPRAFVVLQIPTRGRLFRGSGVVVPGVMMIALLHCCLRIGHEMTGASHLVVACRILWS
jgi:hypothetical protein